MLELKSCPFCNGEAHMQTKSDFELKETKYYISCDKCHIQTAFVTAQDNNHDEAITKVISLWNRRNDKIPDKYKTVDENEKNIAAVRRVKNVG